MNSAMYYFWENELYHKIKLHSNLTLLKNGIKRNMQFQKIYFYKNI